MVEDDLRGPAGLGETDVVGGVLQREAPDVSAGHHARLCAPDLYLGGDVHSDQGARPPLHPHSTAPAKLGRQLPCR